MSAALQAVKHFRVRELAPILKADPKVANARPKILNPFLPHKNPESGRWAPPKYSLRRQADLVKSARAAGLLHLLPPGPKLSPKEIESASASASAPAPVTETSGEAKWWAAPVQWDGEYKEKEVKGADVGNRLYAGRKRMFKGHKWERTLEKRTWKRKMLMKDMEERIERFKSVCGTQNLVVRSYCILTCSSHIDIQTQDPEPRQPCTGGILLQATILMYPLTYSICLFCSHLFGFPLLASRPAVTVDWYVNLNLESPKPPHASLPCHVARTRETSMRPSA